MTFFNIAMGSYEHALLGVDVSVEQLLNASDSDEADAKSSVLHKGKRAVLLKPTFAMPCHLGSVRAVACNSKYLATGSTDETLKYEREPRLHHCDAALDSQSVQHCEAKGNWCNSSSWRFVTTTHHGFIMRLQERLLR
jgi:hypothetical protein